MGSVDCVWRRTRTEFNNRIVTRSTVCSRVAGSVRRYINNTEHMVRNTSGKVEELKYLRPPLSQSHIANPAKQAAFNLQTSAPRSTHGADNLPATSVGKNPTAMYVNGTV